MKGKKLNSECQEIKEEFEAEKEVLKSYQDALNECTIFAVTDTQGRILEVNDMFEKISKYKKEELIGKNHRILKSGHHSKKFFKKMWDEISSGRTWRGEVKNRAKDGSFYWVDTVITPIKNRNGEIEKYMAVRFEITEKKNNEILVQEQHQRLLGLEKFTTIGEMAGAVAHEINGPLTVISLAVGDLQKRKDRNHLDEEDLQKGLDKIIKNVERTIKTINSLRILSRDSSSTEFGIVTLSQIYQDVVELTSHKLKREGINLISQKESDPIFKTEIECDQVQISQTILNILNNSKDAIKMLTDKWIRLWFEIKGDELIITITDSGHGIPLKIQEKIFEYLYTTKKVGEGTGIGLDLCKKFMNGHGGDIKINNQSKNTEFIINLPLHRKTNVEKKAG